MLARPTVGSTITVVVKNLMAFKPVWVPLWNDYTAKSDETFTFKGTVVRPDPWLKTDEFNLTSDLPHFPIRTISLKHVVSIDGAAQSAVEGEKIESKIVKGSKGNEYTVMLTNGVAETCTCPAFRYRGGRCKHLAIASEKE